MANGITKNRDNASRLANLKPPLVPSSHLDRGMIQLYKQAIDCYVFGQYQACCALSRSLVEVLATSFIKKSKFADLLCGKDRDKKRKSIAGILNDLEIEKPVISAYCKVVRIADLVLHARKEVLEKECLSVIESVQLIFRQFPT